MFRFVMRKLLNKKWMALCLLIGNILLISIAACNPLYSSAILQRTLTRTLSQSLTETNVYPAEVTFKQTVPSTGVTQSAIAQFDSLRQTAKLLPERSGVPAALSVEEYFVSSSRAVLLGDRANQDKRSLAIGTISDFQDHIEVISGAAYSEKITDGVIEAVISERLQQQQDLLVGEELALNDLFQPDGTTPYRLKIVGIYRASQENDLYWNRSSTILSGNFIVSEAAFQEAFARDGVYPAGIGGRWSVFLDYTAITVNSAENLIALLDTDNLPKSSYIGVSIYERLTPQLELFLAEAQKLQITLTVLQVPILVLLGAFIFMVSRQMLELEENEIAVIKSRGSSKKQIFRLYLIQGGILSGIGFLCGFPFSLLICQMLGSSNAFLEFVHRTALPLRLNLNALLYAAAAAVVACAAMVLPALRYSNTTIVSHKVRKQSENRAPWWQRIFLDVILLAVSLYALYSFHQQQDFLAVQLKGGGALDPLLYFSSSLFIVGAGLLGIRLVPILAKLIFTAGKKFWPPSLYTAFLRVLRTRSSQSFIMLFLVLTISLGIFNTTAARSINENAEDRIRYLNGADVIVKEAWENKAVLNGDGSALSTSKEYIEPNFEKYSKLAGVESMTKVYYSTDASLLGDTMTRNVTLMGIHTKEFGQTASLKDSLLPHHWYAYLNAMSQDPRAVLVSSSFRDEKGYSIGDVITYTDSGSNTLYGVIYQFVDYWPAFSPRTVSQTATGEMVETTNYLIVANLSQLQATCGVQPYQIWMKMDGSSQPVYDFAQEQNIRFTVFKDTGAALIALKNEPVFQGTNGMLTANFIIVLLLCMVGFLIYWILSIRSRELQFGIFRAMGLSMREIITMLIGEQLLISGSSIGIGIAAGALASRLYLPLIQVAYSSVDQVLPLEMVFYFSDAMRLFIVIAAMIICCMVILGVQISKIRIAQALKLGED